MQTHRYSSASPAHGIEEPYDNQAPPAVGDWVYPLMKLYEVEVKSKQFPCEFEGFGEGVDTVPSALHPEV